MSWAERVIGVEELRPYLPDEVAPGETSINFRSLVQALIAEQQATWPMLRDAVAGFAEVEYKQFSIKGSEVLAQFNPMRRVSTTAQVDAAAISKRPCFLCPENLPPEERGIEFGDDFVVLCNPFPILPRHLVVSSRNHVPQSISTARGTDFAILLDLARELGEEYFTLYNGPTCGASAPDHLHFQACERKWLPIVRDLGNREKGILSSNAEIETFTLKEYHLNALIARGGRPEALVVWFDRLLKLLAEVTASPAEPMLNLVVMSDGERLTVIVFPRSKHRPSCYYEEGDAQLTVSPGAFDLSGLLVVPRPDHFERIGSQDIEKIYSEVTLDDARFDTLVKGLML